MIYIVEIEELLNELLIVVKLCVFILGKLFVCLVCFLLFLRHVLMGDLLIIPEEYKYRWDNIHVCKFYIFFLRNKMYMYILIMVDCFSKKLWAQPLKRKTKEATAEAMEKILDEMKSFPTMIVTDAGKGFFVIL